ncbi:MAG: hypothetical protein AAF806_31780 [Bacteroidota bacterium]
MKEQFTKTDYGWELERSQLLFMGKQVAIDVDTKIDAKAPDQDIFDGQIATLRIILAQWEVFAVKIEKEILAYEGISETELRRVANLPRIYLSLDDITHQPLENQQWSFTLGVNESEDFGWHVEFKGEKYLETWAGG